MTTARTELQAMLKENREALTTNLADVFRRNIEDIIAAGVDADFVIETALIVSMVQGMKARGSTEMGAYLRRCADHFETAADAGVEFPAPDHVSH